MVENKASSVADLQMPVQFLKGVGPDRTKMLARMELHTVRDVLFCFPRDYLDLSAQCAIADLAEGVPASVVVTVDRLDERQSSSGRSVLSVLLRQDQSHCRAVWFNQPFMANRLRVGQVLLVSGAPKLRGVSWEFVHPRVTPMDDPGQHTGPVVPVYRLTDGIKQHHMRRIAESAVEGFAHVVPEAFPTAFLKQHNLMPIDEALREVHLPSDTTRLVAARHRLVYQELFIMQLALAVRRQQLSARACALPLPRDTRIDARIRRLFPFELTESQNQVIAEITSDLAQNVPMNRLLQGDVGSGKTAVAAYAILLAVAHGAQSVLMAPTEVLARQHYQTLGAMLSKSKVRMAYLSGATTAKEKQTIVEGLASGNFDILVGTQAVIQQDVDFHRLALVIIDEQHKFGVVQRSVLRQADTDPHHLVMTATPIPRTVAMTMFGDLDVSALRSAPPGRQPVHTYVGEEAKRDKWWEFFRKKLREGQQGFVITPVVDDQGDDLISAEAALENLANGELADFRLDLLHGRMKPDTKLDVMHRFETGDTQVLVATSVVEVGIDVPNANLMTIEHGERFGISQLHQLRGRVGRGVFPGYVCVFSDLENEEACQRLQAFAASRDGFELAEIDFRLRGPGELFGTRQHGVPPLMVADLRSDLSILQQAREDARAVIASDSALTDSEWHRIRRMLLRRYGHALQLGDVA